MERLQYHKLDESKLHAVSGKGLVIEAHPDDSALGEGIIETLVRLDVGLTGLTLTDGGNRTIRGYTRESLIEARRKESKEAFRISGFGEVYHANLPDGRLTEYSQMGIAIVENIVHTTDPDFIIVTHRNDVHPDHAVAGEIALATGGEEIPVYYMDTQTRLDYNGNDLPISHAFSICASNVALRNSAYYAHRSQVDDISQREKEDVTAVLQLPGERGKEFGVSHAGVLYHANPKTPDVLSSLLSDQVLLDKRKKVA